MSEEHKKIAKKDACPDCASRHIWLKGKTPSRSGQKVRLVCVDCGRTYYPKGEVKWVEKG